MAPQEMAAVNATVPRFPAKELGEYKNFEEFWRYIQRRRPEWAADM
jgi:hypothetical protein